MPINFNLFLDEAARGEFTDTCDYCGFPMKPISAAAERNEKIVKILGTDEELEAFDFLPNPKGAKLCGICVDNHYLENMRKDDKPIDENFENGPKYILSQNENEEILQVVSENNGLLVQLASQLNKTKEEIISKLSNIENERGENSEFVTVENIVKVLEDEAAKKKKKEFDEFTAKPENKNRIQRLTDDQNRYLEKLASEKEWNEYISKCEARLRNIFSMATPFHWIGWPIFLAAVSFGIHWSRKKKKEERKIDNYLDDIKDKFAKWQLNIYLSCAFYVVLFFVAKQFIDYFVEPLVGGWLADKKRFTIASMSFILGVMTIIDNIITSTLKTPLQRLGVKIENSPMLEKEKSKLLSKTQEVNESFKETFKRFGFLAIPSILVSLVGKEEWEKELASNLCYLVPVFWSTFIIAKTNRIVRRVERGKRKKAA